jgi:hypothetical protein
VTPLEGFRVANRRPWLGGELGASLDRASLSETSARFTGGPYRIYVSCNKTKGSVS